MASPSKEGVWTAEQKQTSWTVAQSAEALSSSPRSPTKVELPEIHTKGGVGGSDPTAGLQYLQRTHSGEAVRVKKGG